MRMKIMKKLFMMCILGLMVFGIAGCENNNNTISADADIQNSETVSDGKNQENATRSSSFSAKDAIKIEDIEWSVAEGIIDGERFISFNYTNNSQYTIMDVEMEFRQKKDTTADQLTVFDNLKEEQGWSDEEVMQTYILGYNRKCADPGETVADSPCVINGTYRLVENMDQYEIMEPDMVSIAFIGDDGKGYTIYYDYKTQSYGESSQGAQDLHQWSESEICSLLPKAEYKAVIVSSDDDDWFFFKSFGISREEFDKYVASVKKNGFTEVEFEVNGSYMATNADGIEADISYNSVEETMTGSVTK